MTAETDVLAARLHPTAEVRGLLERLRELVASVDAQRALAYSFGNDHVKACRYLREQHTQLRSAQVRLQQWQDEQAHKVVVMAEQIRQELQLVKREQDELRKAEERKAELEEELRTVLGAVTADR